jgi:hypothetical protein
MLTRSAAFRNRASPPRLRLPPTGFRLSAVTTVSAEPQQVGAVFDAIFEVGQQSLVRQVERV